MSFLLDREQQKKVRLARLHVAKPKPVPIQISTPTPTFKDIYEKERLRYILLDQKREQIQSEILKLQQIKPSTIAELSKTKHEILSWKRQLPPSNHTVAEFEKKTIPYKRMHDEHVMTDESLCQLFRSEIMTSEQVPARVEFINVDVCSACQKDYVYIIDESIRYCEHCGEGKTYIDATKMTVAYGEEVEYAPFQYQRKNHLIELLNHLQVRGTANLPQTVVDTVMRYLYDVEKVRDVKKIDYAMVKKALKVNNLAAYYDQTMQLWCKLTGQQPIRFSPVAEEKIRLMFHKIQAPFMRHCPPGRKNFLSYPYVVHKFATMLGLYDLLLYFPLLKSRDKLQPQEETFQKICNDLGWVFISIKDALKLAHKHHTKQSQKSEVSVPETPTSEKL